MTEHFDTKNELHQKCKQGIEIGNGLPDVRTCEEVAAALKAAGFEVCFLSVFVSLDTRCAKRPCLFSPIVSPGLKDCYRVHNGLNDGTKHLGFQLS